MFDLKQLAAHGTVVLEQFSRNVIDSVACSNSTNLMDLTSWRYYGLSWDKCHTGVLSVGRSSSAIPTCLNFARTGATISINGVAIVTCHNKSPAVTTDFRTLSIYEGETGLTGCAASLTCATVAVWGTSDAGFGALIVICCWIAISLAAYTIVNSVGDVCAGQALIGIRTSTGSTSFMAE